MLIIKHLFKIFLYVLLQIAIIFIIVMVVKIYNNRGVFADHQINSELIAEMKNMVKVGSKPHFRYSYEKMEKGVIQHLDRDYTYDIIPKELLNGILFQGIHRPPKGTVLEIEILNPVTIYFFFHSDSDGGYSEIFSKLNSWKKCNSAPKYDIYNGSHGLKMSMYKMEAEKGIYKIPATTADRACFSIVFNNFKRIPYISEL